MSWKKLFHSFFSHKNPKSKSNPFSLFLASTYGNAKNDKNQWIATKQQNYYNLNDGN